MLASTSLPRRVAGPIAWAAACILLGLSLGCTSGEEEAPGPSTSLAASRAERSGPPRYVPPDRPPRVILYLADTLRADHLGAYGYERPTSPAIDAFAADSVLFEEAQAQSSFTTTSMASVMTGTHPGIHGALDTPRGIPHALPTLAESLTAGGYQSVGLVTIATVDASWGFDRGFELYHHVPEGSRGHVYARAFRLHDMAATWFERHRDLDRPLFMYMHATDVHDPYVPRERFRERWAPGLAWDTRASLVRRPHVDRMSDAERAAFLRDVTNLYDAEIADLDDQFGAFLDGLKRMDLYDDSLIVFLADHGEELSDHGGWNHGWSLYREVLHVPLIIKFPGGWAAGERIGTLVDQTDVMPTILAAAGVDRPDGSVGANLIEVIEGRAERPPRSYARLGLRGQDVRSVIDGRFKLIDWRQREGAARFELYDRIADPLERRDLSAEQPRRVERLAELIERLDDPIGDDPAERAVVGAEMDERLRALGYLD